MKTVMLLAFSLLLIQGAFAQKINVKESKVEFEVSNMGKTVQGTMLNVQGTVNFDANALDKSNFSATVDPATVNTDNKGRDKHLQKDDFFGVKSFTEIKLVSKSISKTETGYEALATLTIRDISMDVNIPFTVEEEEGQQILKGQFSVKRKEYQLGEKMAANSIGLDVNVNIHCVVE